MRDGKTLNWRHRILQINLLMNQLNLPGFVTCAQGIVQRTFKGPGFVVCFLLEFPVPEIQSEICAKIVDDSGSDFEAPIGLGKSSKKENQSDDLQHKQLNYTCSLRA